MAHHDRHSIPLNPSSTWFEDDEALVRELRRGHRVYRAPHIAGYENLKELRRGGQGVVFLGTQASTRRTVAIKVVLEGVLASREARRRFEREIGLVVGLRHPNIVRVYDSGESEDGRLYYIMEYIDGAGLDELIGGATAGGAVRWIPQSRRDWLEMFSKICDGVQHAHQQGVIHRDLKPSNVRLDHDGQPHVLDFGLAKAAVAEDVTQYSQSGSFMGSLPWASPEQAEGAVGRIDVRSDVYSLGVILYQLLTGTFPYRLDGSLRENLQQILTCPPQPPREIRRDISDEVATIAIKCLAKEPERRYQSAGELARDLRRYLAGEPIEAKRDSAWYSVRKTLDRYKVAVRAVSVLLAASLVFSVAMVWLRARAIQAEQLAAQRLADLGAAHEAEVEIRKNLEVQVAKTRKVRDFLDQTLRAVDPWKHPGRDLGPLRELLDSAAQRLDGAFPDQPDVEAAIAGTLGWDYSELGLYDEAEKLLRRSYVLSDTALGEAHPDTMTALGHLGTLLTDRGRHDESSQVFARLREIQIRTLGPEHPATLVTISNLALDLDWQGRSSEAESLYRQALESQTRLLGEQNLDRLRTLNNLAACLPALGKMDEAEALLQELIATRIAVHGANHPETLQARMNLADLFIRQGRLAEAEDLLRKLLTSGEAALTPKHPLVLVIMHNLADVVSNRGRPEEGLALARRAYEAQAAFAGPEHPTTLNRKNELACALIELKRWNEAIPLATELREQWTKLFGLGDWRTLTAAGNLAFAQNQLGETAAAESTWRQIIANADPQHEATAVAVMTAHANLGALLADQNRWADAETEFREALASQKKRGEAGHWRTAFIRAGLGRVLAETHRTAEAETELLEAYAGLQKALGNEHEKTQRAVGYLIRLYEKTGNTAAAEQYLAKRKPDVATKTTPG